MEENVLTDMLSARKLIVFSLNKIVTFFIFAILSFISEFEVMLGHICHTLPINFRCSIKDTEAATGGAL